MSGSFFDSNVLLYLVADEQDRRFRVRQLVDGGGTISVQVMNEMTSVARRKFRMSWSETKVLLTETQDLLAIIPLTLEIHQSGLRLAERHGFSIYDSFIVAAALAAGCDTLAVEASEAGLEGRSAVGGEGGGDVPVAR